ncbi:MAG TPA: PEGA domain-containing protein [Gemmatimonadales bacterium]|nr:PEGA domain-containing protein [Gemmatimonadales bacterium]
MNRSRCWTVAGLIVATTVFWACATIIHGSSQEVSFSSQPTGAKVTVDGQPAGNTPVVAHLRRKDTHTVSITMDGYQPFEIATTRSVSGWVWGNIVFGGLIGLAVDAITGGLYNVKPDQVQAQLSKTASRAALEDGSVYVFLVREPDPNWQLIGQLTPAH